MHGPERGPYRRAANYKSLIRLSVSDPVMRKERSAMFDGPVLVAPTNAEVADALVDAEPCTGWLEEENERDALWVSASRSTNVKSALGSPCF